MQVLPEDGEMFESLLRRFSQKVKRAGVLSEFRRRRFFVSKGVERRAKIKKSQQRQRRRAARK